MRIISTGYLSFHHNEMAPKSFYIGFKLVAFFSDVGKEKEKMYFLF